MTQYVIAELKLGETGGFSPRGALKELWKSRDFETIVSGPAETGKTWGCLNYVDALLWKYPGAQGVMVRKVLGTLVGSAVRTYLRIIGPNSPIRAYGGEHPQWFDYPNGSRLWLAGMDKPGKALSSERDFVYICQAEELALEDFETLTTRATGRGAVMPYTRVFGDCNPGSPQHWIMSRSKAGRLRMLESRHTDNPTLYDDAGNITEQGKRTMSILDSLTGARRLRLRDGKWAKAEGLVYEEFDRARHVISRAKFDSLNIRRFVGAQDWGYTNPGVSQIWGIDGDGRMFLTREIYMSQRTIDWWIEEAGKLNAKYHPEAWACDPAEPAFIEQFRQSRIPVQQAFNDIMPGVSAVQQRIKSAGDGRPRIYVVEGCNEEIDEALAEAKQPLSSLDESESYSWPKAQDGKVLKEVPADKDNHGMDAWRYAVAYVDGLAGRVELDDEWFMGVAR